MKCYIIITDLDWSLSLFGNKLKKFTLVQQTVSRWEASTGWGTILEVRTHGLGMRLRAPWAVPHPSISLFMILSTKKAGRRERMKIDTAANGLPSTNHISNTAGMEIQ